MVLLLAAVVVTALVLAPSKLSSLALDEEVAVLVAALRSSWPRTSFCFGAWWGPSKR